MTDEVQIMKKYNSLCIGSGPGGYSAAISLSKAGKSVALVDYSKEKIGGVCLNEGCIPVKAIIKISKLYYELNKEGKKYGFEKGISKPDINKIIAYSKNTSSALKEGLLYLFKKYKIDFIEGEARILKNKQVEVKLKDSSSRLFEAENIILASGSQPAELEDLKIDKDKIISSREAIKINRIPQRILIVGAGAIGLEFASIFSCLGSQVLLIEIKEQILPGEDKEIATSLQSIFKKRGIDVQTQSKVEKIKKSKDSVRFNLKTPEGEEEKELDLILVAAGRKPNIDKDYLHQIGIETQGDFVKVDGRFRTSHPGVYAVGDITSYPMFAHAAYKEAEVASLDIAGSNPTAINRQDIPRVIYSSVQAASIGLTEKQAEDEKLDYEVIKQQYRANPRALLSNHSEGLVKLIIDKVSHKLIGAHLLGEEASELIHQFAIAKTNDLTVEDLSKVIYAHPTFSEIIKEATSSFLGKSIHT
jgi:dihydrolipoamide dehydrogenase